MDNREVPQPTPSVLKEISKAIKEKGTYEKDLSPQEVEQMMTEIVTGLIAGGGRIDGNVQSLSVVIQKAKARLKASVGVSSPIKAGIDLFFGLENGHEVGNLKLFEEPIIVEHPNGMKAKIALKAANLKGRLSSQLASPNELISKGLGDYFKKDGIRLQALSLALNPTTLRVGIQGTVQ